MLEIYETHYESLSPEGKVSFLNNLRKERKAEFLPLAERWIEEFKRETVDEIPD